jgi:hypothetical protein
MRSRDDQPTDLGDRPSQQLGPEMGIILGRPLANPGGDELTRLVQQLGPVPQPARDQSMM